MFKRIIDQLVPPFFADDEEKTRIARLLNVIVLSSLAGAVFYLTFAQFERIPYIILAIAVIVSVWLVMKRGYVQVASIAMVMGLLAIFVVVIFTGGGLRAPAYSGLMIVILFAGLILGWRSAVSMALFSVLYGILLLIVDALGMSPQPTTYTNIALWIIESIFFVMAGVFLMLALRTIEDAFRRANRELTERNQAEEALRELQNRQQKILDSMFAFVGLFSLDGILLEANRAPLEAAGLKAEDVIGKPFADLYIWSHSEAARTQVRLAIQHAALGETVRDDFLMRIPGGQLITLDVVFSPLRDSSGNIIQVVGSGVDITERKQAEEKIQLQNQRLSALREIDTAILAADSVENIVGAALSHIRELIDCRRASLTLIDWAANEALTFDVRTINETSIPTGTRIPLALFQDMLQSLSKNQPVLINDLRALADPPPQIQSIIREGLRSTCILPLFSQSRLSGAFSMSSEIPGFFDEEKISLGREVANQVAIAITQNRLVVALEERVLEREKLIAELTAKNAELENFTYSVSHDLKSPLVTMKGFLGYLVQDAATGNVERLKEDSQRIASAVEKMQELLNDLLELSRVGRFVNPSETISFEELIRVTVDIVRGRLEARGVTVQIQPNLPMVYVDRQRLIEVLQNLLDNAAKYMGDQTEPRIEIGQRGEDAERGQPIFYVKDNGIGIAPEYRERVFGLFNKLDARSEGTGIGLALVRRIIEFHGGRIWVESDLEEGSAFCFTLSPSGQA